jgi:hypothetical protein
VTELQALDRPDPPTDVLRIAVLLPCKDEEPTIAEVISGFRSVLPTAHVYVYDNGSVDRTAERASAAGATVRHEPKPGKGAVVRRMFADVDADVYVIADGDGTYDAASAPEMIRRLAEENLDMVVGSRLSVGDAYPRGHVMGNRLFNRLLRLLFNATFTDVFSGYRVLSRRFVKSFASRFTGFEIETELTAHAVEIGLPYAEVETPYGARDEGSLRKLRTLRDGARILIAAVLLFKEMRPLFFFSVIASILTVVAVALGAIVVEEFLATGLVPRLPTAVLAASIQIVAFICLTAGLVLDSVCRTRRETKRLVYLGFSPVQHDPSLIDAAISPSSRVRAPQTTSTETGVGSGQRVGHRPDAAVPAKPDRP